MSAAEWWAQWRPAEEAELELEEPGEGLLIIRASELSFYEAKEPAKEGGRPRRKGHHYAWGRCSACGELRLGPRAPAAMRKKRCLMTPGCPGHLEPAEDEQALPRRSPAVDLALRAFPGSEVVR